ncbi:MAG TPA: OB-fold domain-containing protein [Acidimicrobiales bacterium]
MGGRIPLVDYLALDGDEPRLVANACDGCGAVYFDRRNACARCSGTSFAKKPLATEGSVRAFTIVKRAAPGVPVPYVSAVVDLDGGGTVKANVVGTDPTPETVRLGMPVRLVTFPAGTDDEGTEAVAFGFAPNAAKEETS